MKALLTSKQSTALEALLSGQSRQEAASLARVHHRTLTRWLTLPAFKEALKHGQASRLQQVYQELTLAALEAVSALRELLETPHQRGAQVKARAAHSILSLLPAFHQVIDLEERVSLLERERHEN